MAQTRKQTDVLAPPSALKSFIAANSLNPLPNFLQLQILFFLFFPQTHLHPPRGKPQGAKPPPLQSGASPTQPPHQAQGPGGEFGA